jgi:fibronectin type 3 domain-containing protein
VLSSSSIQVSWSGASGASGYRVYRSSSAGGYYSFIGSANFSPYTDNGLSAGTTYYYKVSSLKDSQESALSSNYVSATTQTSGGTIENAPTMPTGLKVSSVSSGSITLSWDSVPTANGYNVYRSNVLNGAEAKITSTPISSTSYTNSVPAGASYYYKVTGVNSLGESPKSAGAFAYAEPHYTMSYYSSAQNFSLVASGKHYYRLAVTNGQSYTIEWQNGNTQNTPYGFTVYAYQNNGTQIFSRSGYNNGYTDPPIFTATATGFVTVEVYNNTGSAQNYQIYYY